MTKPLLLTLVAFGAIACAGSAGPEADSHDALAVADSSDAVVETFVSELVPIFRASKEEQGIADYLERKWRDAKTQVWHDAPGAELERDAMHNVLIRLPATGRFRAGEYAPVAIQAHLDMVLAVKSGVLPAGATTDELKAYFRQNPIQVVRDADGTLHSKDQTTTLGADNGVGVAMALRYLTDDTLEHPPLELVFTVQEETSMDGAIKFGPEIRAKVFINLDSPDPDKVTITSQGGSAENVSGDFAAVPAAAMVGIKLALDGLRGGHSGHDIAKPRLGAINAFALLLRRVSELAPGTLLVSASSGGRGKYGSIQTSFTAGLALPASTNVATVAAALEATLRTEVLPAYADEASPTLTFASDASVDPSASGALAGPVAEAMTTLLHRRDGKPLDGVLERDDAYPNGVKLSSNWGALSLGNGPAGQKQLLLGFFTRGYEPALVRTTRDGIASELGAVWSQSGATPSSQVISEFSGWRTTPDHWLVKLALEASAGRFAGVRVSSGGIEPGPFSGKLPGTVFVSFGADVRDQHTTTERVTVDSIKKTSATLQRLLTELADSPDYRAFTARR